MRILRLLTIAVVIQIWTGAVIYAHGQTVPTEVKQAMIAREREKHQCALLMLDLDNFKNLNDAIGHAQGDEVLQRVAKRLNAATRDGDTVARLGGDEFVVLLDHLNQDPQVALRQTQTVANKMLEALKKPYHLAGSTNSCTASIGITFFGEKYEDTLEPLSGLSWPCTRLRLAGATRFASSTRGCRPWSMPE